MKNLFYKIFYCLVFLFLLPTFLNAQYNVSRIAFGNGVGIHGNADYVMYTTTGQIITGSTMSSENIAWLGFWNSNRTVVAVEDDESLLPDKFELSQNYPNPFNPSTKIKYSIPEVSNVLLEVFNILGEKIYTLIDNEHEPGFYTVDFNASNLASGFYIYRLQAKKFVDVKKMIVLK